MSVPLPKQVRRNVRSVLVAAVARLLAFVPLRPALAVASLVAWLAWLFARRTRAQMLEQLALAFPEKPAAERAAIGRASLRHLAWLAAEVATLRRTRGRLRSFVSWAPGCEELFHRLVSRGRGLVFVTGHVGNWELLAQRIAADHPAAVIARIGNDPAVTRHLGRIRAEGRVETLWREEPGTARAMIRCFKQGRPLGILIDQDTKVQSVFVPFFGRLASTPRAAADLALRFGAPVMVGWARRRGAAPGAGHEIACREIAYDPRPVDEEAEVVRVTAACTAALEAAIRANPSEWVWMHERWKTQPAEADAQTQAKPVPETVELSGY
jgi:KDO2-lipid IV(A) lauroyltransferase